MPHIRRCHAGGQQKRLKKSPVYFFERGKDDANATEVLLWAILTIYAGHCSASELKMWAKAVLEERRQATELKAAWAPKLTWGWHKNLSKLFSPVMKAFYETSWSNEDLDKVGLVIQAWDGDGAHDNLTSVQLKDYIKAKPPSVGVTTKRPGPPRFRSWQIVHAAEIVLKHGAAIRRALKLDIEMEEVPTSHERAAAAEARIIELEEDKVQLGSLLTKAQDALRKAAERRAAAKEAKAAKAAKAKAAAKEKAAKQRADIKARVDARVERQAERVRLKLEAASTADEKKRKDEVARARERARIVESEAKAAGKRLRRAKKAEARVKELEVKLDEWAEQEEPPESPTTDKEEKVGNKFTPLPWKVCPVIYGQLARRTPPTAINQNITDVLRTFATEKDVPLPCVDEIRRMRGQLTVAGECLAAFRVALARRIVSFGFDESTKFGMGLLSTNTQLEPHDAPGTTIDVVQRGACLTAGGTAEEICKSIDVKIFSHSRRLLEGWRAEHEKIFGVDSWAADGGPTPEAIGMHRLSEETLLMSDTCNAARAAKRLLAEAAEKASRLKIGDAAWAKMSEAERERSCTTFIGDCHQHLRNILINAMGIAATDYLKAALEDDLAEFSSFDRMSVDGMDLIRAIYKELHPGQEYAKGKGREFFAWLMKQHPTAMYVPFENAKGSRQDMAFDGALPIFANRIIALDFLHGLVNVPRADNQLEKFLWRVLRCNEMTALLRANTLIKLVITDAMRWLTGKAHKLEDWSIVTASRVLELAEDAFIKIAADGRTLFDPAFAPFAEITASQPLFRKWQVDRMKRTVKSSDGTVKYRIYERVLAEARAPESKGNAQATTATITLIEKMATAALTAMHDAKRAIADKLTSQNGENAPTKRQKMHLATKGAHVANDRVESIFGSYDYVGHIFRGTSVENLSGLAQQMRSHDFDRAENVRKRKESSEPAQDGFYHRLPERLQQSLVAFARREAPRARRAAKDDLAMHDEAKLLRREERVITLLNKAVEDYAYAKELFHAWQADTHEWRETAGGVRPGEVVKTDAKWSAFTRGKPESEVLMFLRKQIDMRVLGCGLFEFATRWSSNKDAKIGTVAHLRTLLTEILEHEMTARRMKELPEDGALPQQVRRDLGKLGTVDEDAADVEKRALFSPEELDAKAQQEMQRRLEAGISDSVEDLNGGVNHGEAPAFDQGLVGKRLEVLWPYQNSETGARVLIWATGCVARVADGLTDKRSTRAQKVLPAGMVLWAWDADPEFEEPAGEKWLALLPKKWNKQQLYSWRYDPREFSPAATPQRDSRRRNAVRMDCDDA